MNKPDRPNRTTSGLAVLLLAPLLMAPLACGSKTQGTSPADGGVGGGGTGGANGAGGVHGTGGSGSGSGGSMGVGTGGNPGGTGGGAGARSSCAGISLRQDGALDLNLRAVSVTGTVTLNGAVPPDQTTSRGLILFRGNGDESTLSLDLGSSGPATYAARLPPGTYDIYYAPGTTACSAASTSAMPCGTGLLLQGVSIIGDGALDVNIPAVTVTGSVTLKGATPPDQTRTRGSLSFSLSSASGSIATTAAFAATGAITYRVNLLPGTYDIFFNGDATGCTQATAPPDIPCTSGVIRKGVALSASGVLDIDVPAVKVTGSVLLNGAPMPDEATARGSLAFAGMSAVTTRAFGNTGPASYAVTLLPGAYTVSLAANNALCGPSATPDVPCLGGVVMASANLTTDGVLDVDLHAVTVTGTVTLGGQPLPTAAGDRGGLSFTSTTGAGGGTLRTLGTSGAGAYRARLLAGTYNVDYVGNGTLCNTTTPPALPCTGGSIARGVALTTDGVLDADLHRVAVTGAVTVSGAPMPTASANRGALTFVRADGASVTSASFGSSGAASYALSLWPGSYEVRFAANAGLCSGTSTPPPVPCTGGVAHAATTLQSDGVLDVDISAVKVSGAITLNGGPLPSETMDRGSLTFGRVAAEAGTSVSFALGTSAPGTYATTLMGGNYVIRHAAMATLCSPTRALPGVPCASQVLVGCP